MNDANLNLSELSANQRAALNEILNFIPQDENIEMSGYNETSGNIWVMLENGICIAAPDFRPSQVSFFAFYDEGEVEYDTYQEAVEALDENVEEYLERL